MTNLYDRGTGQARKPFRPDYVPKVALIPQTLDDLMQRAGRYADATRTHIEWSGITVWTMKEGYQTLSAIPELSNGATSLAIHLVREAEEQGAGWPSLSGKIVTPAIYGYSQDCQGEARRITTEVRSLWEAAGRPYVRASDCKFAFQYLVACVRKGIIPPLPSLGVIPSSPLPHRQNP